jgi:hypothetical protein
VRNWTLGLVLASFFLPVAADADLVAPRQDSLLADEEKFLRPYIDELKKETPVGRLNFIRSLPEDTLWILHHDYGMWIRNKWLWGDRNPKLIRFFRAKKITHPDEMSKILIKALWRDLDRGLTPQERIAVEAKRSLRSRREKLYGTLAEQCTSQVVAHKSDLERCYPSPSAGDSPNVFFFFAVSPTGTAGEITCVPKSASDCVKAVVDTFTFSSFDTDAMLHLWITAFPKCGVQEFDRLYE